MFRRAVAAIALAAWPIPCEARTGSELLSDCTAGLRTLAGESRQSSARAGACFAYLDGYVNAMAVARVMSNQVPVCMPNGVTIEQVARVVVKYLTDHPETLHFEAGALTGHALKSAFPCS